MTHRYPVDLWRLLERECAALDYWFPTGDRDLWLGGIRNPSRRLGLFDDVIVACMMRDGERFVDLYPATTDPGHDGDAGDDARLHRDGTAIMQPQQVRGMLSPGIHKRGSSSEHLALRQVKPARFVRDRIRDGKMSTGEVVVDLIGANLHRPWRNNLERVGFASLACQVVHDDESLDEILALAGEQAAAHPDWSPDLTYTLLDAAYRPAMVAILDAAGRPI